MTKKEKPSALFLVSLLILFIELAFIRYLGSEFPAVGFFKNLILIASFVGLGIGLSQNLPLKFAFLFYAAASLLPHLLLIFIPRVIGFVDLPYFGLEDEAVLVAGGSAFLGILFLSFSFVSTLVPMTFLGRIMGHYFDGFERPLNAYTWNILGSLAGILLFSLISFFAPPPLVWFGIGTFIFLVLVFPERGNMGKAAAGLTAGFALLAIPGQLYLASPEDIWSPYYKITLTEMTYESGEHHGYGLNVNKTWFQQSFDVTNLGREEELGEAAAAGRNLRFVAPFSAAAYEDVLITGSGLGNDTATAVHTGAGEIWAIDIDPIIVSLSDSYHPNTPYQNENVHVVIDDARHYLSSSDQQFDLIIFGVLEARSLFSQFSNLRLDNYVYTVEAIEAAEAHLKPGGILWLNIWVPQPWVLTKFDLLMGTVFGTDYFVLNGKGSQHYSFVGGKEVELDALQSRMLEVPNVQAVDPETVAGGELVTVPTDDWPYVFYRTRQFPITFLSVIVLLVAISVVPLVLSNRNALRIQWDFFFLGAGFLLVETWAVIRMALVAGTTWLVNSAVFAGVLLFVLLANWIVSKGFVRNIRLVFVALFASLVFLYLFPFNGLLRLPNQLAIGIAAFLLTIPIFFAGIVYSILFKQAEVPSLALSSNLLGAILGGFSEYFSMLVGNRMIALLALLLYFLAFVAMQRGKKL